MFDLERDSPTRLRLENPYGFPVRIFANEAVAIDRSATEELCNLMELAETVERIRSAQPDFFSDRDVGLVEVAVSPDFHKGKGIPIGTALLTKGFVVPQAVGNDVNCGMRLHAADLTEEQVRRVLPDLERRIRHIFFEGGREIPMHRIQRESLLKEGLAGLLQTHVRAERKGLWSWYDPHQQERDLQRVIGGGGLPGTLSPALEDYLGSDRLTYDDQIGSIGGGNHFVELQVVKKIFDGQTAYAWGLRPGRLVVMIHTGCVKLGYPTGTRFADVVREIYPKSLPHPQNGVFVLPAGDRFAAHWQAFWTSYANAVNFAFGNRLFLSLMIRRAVAEVVGETSFPLVYDSGHNVISTEEINGQRVYLHRKGATPARGLQEMGQTELAYYGEPVLIPGSMGAPSFVLAGLGNRESLFSASHGAGRSFSRGQSIKAEDSLFRQFLKEFTVVTPIDPSRADVRSRPDILRKWEEELKTEAPYAYKEIGPVIETQVSAGTLRNIAELKPILTVKG